MECNSDMLWSFVSYAVRAEGVYEGKSVTRTL